MGIGEIKWSKFRRGGSSWDQRTLGGSNGILLLLNMDCSTMAWGPHRQSVSIIRPWVQFLGPLAQLWSPLAVWAWLGPDKLRDQSEIKRAAERRVDAGLRDKRDKNRKGGGGSGQYHAGRHSSVPSFFCRPHFIAVTSTTPLTAYYLLISLSCT